MRVVIACGGTAGHVNPGLALAAAFDGDVVFIGARGGVEGDLFERAGHDFNTIDVRGFDRSKPLSIVPTGLRALGAVREARALLQAIRPSVVVGMGGYVSLPVAIAARRTPVVLHEQNIVLGLSNRVGKRFAERVAVSFEETLDAVGPKGVLTGNPVGRDVVEMDREVEKTRAVERFDMDPGRRTVIIFGGSLGAKRINDAAAGLASIWAERSDRQILHITGLRDEHASSMPTEESNKRGLIYRRVRYVDRMIEAYALADLAVTRGGATSLAELCIAGVPSIVVPYPFHRDRQQELQARALERAGASAVLPDEEASGETLAARLDAVLGDTAELAARAAAARRMARPHAAEALAAVLEEVGG